MTGQQVFNKTMTIMDEITSLGAPDPTTTAVYAVKAPNLIDMLQNELMPLCDIYKTINITASGTEGYVKVTLPVDYIDIYELVDSDFKTYSNFKKVGNDIYVPFDFNGELIYKFMPITITSLTQAFEIDDVLAINAMPYGLASLLLLGEDTNKANYFSQKYDEAKIEAKKPKLSQINQVEDIYGGI